MQDMTYLETGSTDPYYNLAFEETVLRERREGDYLILWQNDNTIVIGQKQNTAAEVNASFVEAHHVNVVRRATGGGAVYHDLGNLNYSFITDEDSSAASERFTQPIVRALRSLGLEAEASGRNDILANGRKVSGTAQRHLNGRVLHHGTLLFDSDMEVLSQALQVRPEKYRSKGVASVRARVANIRSLLPQDMTLPDFWQYLREHLSERPLQTDTLTEQELREVAVLRESKYATWEWNYGRSLAFERFTCRKWDGGFLEISLNLDAGRISDIRLQGDFLSLLPVAPVEEALRSCPFSRAAMAEKLAVFDLTQYFGTITAEEILDTVFDAE